MGLGSALLRLGGVRIQSVGGVKRLIALYYGKISASPTFNLSNKAHKPQQDTLITFKTTITIHLINTPSFDLALFKSL